MARPSTPITSSGPSRHRWDRILWLGAGNLAPGTTRLELLDRSRPVSLQESRQGAVGQDLAAGLAARAVVGLVVGVPNALHPRSADRARFLISAMHGHLRAECRHLFRKAITRLGAKSIGPLNQYRA